MKTSSEKRWSLFLLILLISADLVFCGVEILYAWEYTGNHMYSLTTDRGYAEVYGYIKFFWIIIGLLWLTYEKYQPVYIVAALLFFYFLLDDSMKLHETMSGNIIDWFDLVPALDLRAQDVGEITVSVFVGFFFLITGWLAFKYSDNFARRVGFYLLIGVIGLAFFGVGADILHQILWSESPWINTPLVILEDGGELIVVSVICWFVYSLVSQELSLPYIHPPIK